MGGGFGGWLGVGGLGWVLYGGVYLCSLRDDCSVYNHGFVSRRDDLHHN